MSLIPELRLICNECGHIFYDTTVSYCEDCGSHDIDEADEYDLETRFGKKIPLE